MALSEWLCRSNTNDIVIFEVDPLKAIQNKNAYQTDNNNIFGALIGEVGGIYISSIVRIFGSTSNGNLRDIYDWNEKFGCSSYIIIGDDIYGGIFAINLTLKNINPGDICYYAPETLIWEGLGVTLVSFFNFLKNGDLLKFYSNICLEKYMKIQKKQIPFNKTLSIYPPQWSSEFKTSNWSYKEIDSEQYTKAMLIG